MMSELKFHATFVHWWRYVTFVVLKLEREYDDHAKVDGSSGGALYIMFENHVRSWPLLKHP